MKRILSVLAVLCLVSAGALWAQELTIDWQKSVVGTDPGDYFTFTGKINSVTKDQFDPSKKGESDAVTGASKFESTTVFNAYRFDVQGKKVLPGAVRYMLLYPLADDGTRSGDGLSVTKAATGAITVRFVHRGTAFEIVTDAAGKLVLPASIKTRKIGYTDNSISTDFASKGTVATVDWAKVWDDKIADGKDVAGKDGKVAKTGKIAMDSADSAIYQWTGPLQFSFDGKILKVSGALTAAKK